MSCITADNTSKMQHEEATIPESADLEIVMLEMRPTKPRFLVAVDAPNV